jgi:hypothetical protein
MKQVILSVMILLAILSSCSKDETISQASEQAVSTSALPVKVTEYIANNYPAETITSAVKVTNGEAAFIVSLNTLEELAFDRKGGFIGNGAYFHPGGDSLGHHNDSTGFHHDSIGGGHMGPGHGGLGHGGHGGHGHGEPGSISLDSLPSSISDYILANFTGSTAKHAEIKSNCQFDSVYEVMIVFDTLHPVKIYFGLTGNYLMKSDRVLYATAPQSVKDYISANYTGYSVMTKMELFTLADNSLEYEVFVELQHSRKSVLLLADGTFICEKGK